MKTEYRITRYDRLLAGGILAVALLWFALSFFVAGGEGAFVQVTQNGKVILVCSLTEDAVHTFTDKSGGKNTLCIREGKAFMSDADCPDRLCMRQRSISRAGESIICLPHRLAVEVLGGENTEVDAVAG